MLPSWTSSLPQSPLDTRSRCSRSSDDIRPESLPSTPSASAAPDPKARHPTTPRRRQSTLTRWSRSSLDPKASRPSRLQTPCSLHHWSFEGDLWFRAPLLRFVRPFNASGWLRPLSHQQAGSSRGVTCRFVPPSPFQRPRRFTPQSIPVRVSPSNAHGVQTTLQGFPPREDRSVTGATFPS
jgi:hypothetical protein